MAEKKVPKHIAFIMDGNGRWAKKRALPRKIGHKYGVEALKKVVDDCYKRGIEAVTFYAFSTENWSRPQNEIDAIFDLIKKFADTELSDYVKKGYKVMFSGDLSALPEVTKISINKIIDGAKDNTGMIVNLAINYGGRQELIMAINKALALGYKTLDENILSKLLYTANLPDPDIIVRSSGEKRLSNFLLWQCAYCEFIFVDELWPDFDSKVMDNILIEYFNRNRRYGKI